MNDRFKFRFWDKEINQMRYGDVAIDNEGCPFVLTEQKKLTVIERLDNIIPLQCTGLKDKNGKLIYEGDICEYEFEEIGKQKAIIEFNKKYAAFLMKPLNDFQYANINDCEVIGNKFENPELLKECENE